MRIIEHAMAVSALRKRHGIVLAALVLLLMAVYSYAFFAEPHLHWEARMSEWIQTLRHPLLDQIMLAITMSADQTLMLLLLGGLVFMLLIDRQWWLSIFVACIFSSAHLGVVVIKVVTQRPRPYLSDSLLQATSFPSGHTTRSVLVLGLLALLMNMRTDEASERIWIAMAVLIALLVAVSRVYLGVHWPTDVIAGAAFAGALLVGASWQLQVNDYAAPEISRAGVGLAVLTAFVVYYLIARQAQALLYGL